MMNEVDTPLANKDGQAVGLAVSLGSAYINSMETDQIKNQLIRSPLSKFIDLERRIQAKKIRIQPSLQKIEKWEREKAEEFRKLQFVKSRGWGTAEDWAIVHELLKQQQNNRDVGRDDSAATSPNNQPKQL